MSFASPEQRQAFIAGIPKAELHLHIEGSLEPEMMFALAQRNAIDIPFASAEEVRKAYAFSNLQDFLDIYYQGMNVLRTEEDFYDLTMAYFRRIHADNAIHAEIFFDPQGHTERGVAFSIAIDGILRALDDAQSGLNISSQLIMCFLRHLSEEDALATLEKATPYLDRIAGVGLDSSELGHPPSKFTKAFAKAKALGLKAVAHAGEEGPPDYVWEALDVLKIERMDHGNRSLEDPRLVERLRDNQMTLTVCPLSNLSLCVVNDLRDHPLKKMLDLGLRATVNSDDPSYFGGYLNDNYEATASALDLDKDDIVALAKNSFRGSFLDEEAISRSLRDIDDYVARFDG
ncbi:adenosine deaminase [Parasphingorhabdus cellanae]|uniref:Adenine deaminase n=1 Tax=Parasphingorhabdus cellanae TaxID=2806553 RepID=A0ABX7T1P9_9SPHN|nr:adenosine deaminase [Parasphingorhabdus cellanae]QTD54710.1 adenosine deaminase [Parasphingorhabdus cellanae]